MDQVRTPCQAPLKIKSLGFFCFYAPEELALCVNKGERIVRTWIADGMVPQRVATLITDSDLYAFFPIDEPPSEAIIGSGATRAIAHLRSSRPEDAVDASHSALTAGL